MKKKKLALVFGGKSAEYEISIRSARSIFHAIDRDKFDLIFIAIDLSGKWHHIPYEKMHEEDLSSLTLYELSVGVDFFSAMQAYFRDVDVVFPVMHGPYGEDGSIQGLFHVAEIPCVGAKVIGSAIGMDKDVMKRLLKEANIPIAEFMVFRKNQSPSYHDISKVLGEQFFIKPANMGSSLGLSLVKSEEEFADAWQEAFLYDHKVVVEKRLYIREIECSVLGLDEPIVSLPGELVPKSEVYSYHAKYIDPDGARFILPAELSDSLLKRLQKMAIDVFKVLCTDSMARIDFFIDSHDEIFVNEINTIPGFTSISLYPKLWEISGIGYRQLIENLIDIAIERHERGKSLQLEMRSLYVTTGSE